jgi:hypothetical protein
MAGEKNGLQSDKTMFEIYREEGYGRLWRVVYFTELNDHNREIEISRAMAGEHLYDGFIKNYGKDDAKTIIARFVEKLNSGEKPEIDQLLQELQPFTA